MLVGSRPVRKERPANARHASLWAARREARRLWAAGRGAPGSSCSAAYARESRSGRRSGGRGAAPRGPKPQSLVWAMPGCGPQYRSTRGRPRATRADAAAAVSARARTPESSAPWQSSASQPAEHLLYIIT
eukprot:5927560-Prymnesium_polylepis.1